MWVARAGELQGNFHNFFATEFTTWEIVEDKFTMFAEETFAFRDTGDIFMVKFEPPVCFELCESCGIYKQGSAEGAPG